MSGFLAGAAHAAFKLAFQTSPVFLTGGSASAAYGGTLPLVQLFGVIASLASGQGFSLDDTFASFQPLPGATLIDNEFSQYPFANQAVAANAVIAQPLQISMLMICPVRTTLGYASKIAIMYMLRQAFDTHNKAGGTYTVLTPSAVYTNCLFKQMRDVSSGESHQVQHTWQLDFFRPLLTQEEASAAQSNLFSKLTNQGVVTDPNPSSAASTVGQVMTPGVTTPAPSVTPIAQPALAPSGFGSGP